MNYFQTVDDNYPIMGEKRLSDLDEASSWARDAIRRSYGAGYIKGTKPPKEDIYGNISEKGYFDTKGNLTREQAIIVISRLGKGRKDVLDYLVLRGFVNINMDHLMSGFDISGNTVKMRKSSFKSKYSEVKLAFRGENKTNKYADNYTTEALNAALLTPFGAVSNMLDNYHLDKVLSGNQTYYDYKLFTVEHNKDGYLVVITKNPGYGYTSNIGGRLFYGDRNEYTVTVLNNGELE